MRIMPYRTLENVIEGAVLTFVEVTQQKLLQMDLIEAVIGLAPNLFYGAGLAASILVLRKRKPAARRNKLLIADASRLFRRGRAQNHPVIWGNHLAFRNQLFQPLHGQLAALYSLVRVIARFNRQQFQRLLGQIQVLVGDIQV